MAKLHATLDDRLQKFIRQQKIFFVTSSPLSPEGHANLSPEGFDTFRILGPKTVAYLDYTGSGVESIAHIKENGRFTVMFCSFAKSPKILRLHGTGSVIERSDADWTELIAHFTDCRLARAIIRLSIERICDSCGWGVPLFEYQGEREQFRRYDERQEDADLRRDQRRWNMKSVDDLPGLKQTSL